MRDNIDHPEHYNDYSTNFNGQETIETWEQLGIGFEACTANAIKYLDRCGKKQGARDTEDMEKAHWYIDRALSNKPVNLSHCENSSLLNCLNYLGEFDIKKARFHMQNYISLRLAA